MGTSWVTLPESVVTATARAGLRRAAAGRALPGELAMSLRCRQFPALSIDPCEVLREAGASIGAKPWAAARPKAFLGRGMQDPASGAGSQSRNVPTAMHLQRCCTAPAQASLWGQSMPGLGTRNSVMLGSGNAADDGKHRQNLPVSARHLRRAGLAFHHRKPLTGAHPGHSR